MTFLMVLLSFDKTRHIIVGAMLALKFIMRSACFSADKRESQDILSYLPDEG